MPPKRNESPKRDKAAIAAGATADCVFPEEIMLCILTRLPVKSILRFKSVCKPWGDLFSTREFMKMHRGQFSCDPKNQSFITSYWIGVRTISLLEIESDEKKPTILQLPHPVTYLMNIVGCYNGLICMCLQHFEMGKGGFVLWNPATKLFKFVRPSENEGLKRLSLGFGYDAEGDDFKVVRIVCAEIQREGEMLKTDRLEVYSVNSESWITIDPGFLFVVDEPVNVAIVNGNPYWCATVVEYETGKSRSIDDRVLLRFDVKKMVLSRHSYRIGEAIVYAVVNWKGSIAALVVKERDERVVKSIDVWVFDDGDQIWRKNHTLGPMELKLLDGFLAFSKNGKMLCSSRKGKMFLFEPKTGCVSKVYDVQPPISVIYPHLYTEGLTYIKGMTREVGRKITLDGGPLAATEDVSCFEDLC